MQHRFELTKTILLVTIFLPGFACSSETHPPTGWNQFTPQNIRSVPLAKLKSEEQKAAQAENQMASWLSQNPDHQHPDSQEMLAFRKAQLTMIQAELTRRAAAEAVAPYLKHKNLRGRES